MSAYLKYHYPAEYINAVLTYSTDDDKKFISVLSEARRMAIKIVPPEVNKSTRDFVVGKGCLVSPWTAIKRVGDKAIEVIEIERKNGKFLSFQDFVQRTANRALTIATLTNIVLANTFRKFGKMEVIYDELLEMRGDKKVCRQIFCYECKYRYPVNVQVKKLQEDGIVCPYCGSAAISHSEEACTGKRINKQYAQDIAYGYSFKPSKLKQFVDIIAAEKANTLALIEQKEEGEMIKVAFEVIKVKKHTDKNGNEMGFVDITDGQSESSITVFASDWSDVSEHLQKGKCFIASLKKNRGKLLFDSRKTELSQLTKYKEAENG
jgi:DNA polymerase-3 subunit alpha